ncbi:MAG: tetratricopeptide repeat protein [Gemmatimonadaceae bacterium]
MRPLALALPLALAACSATDGGTAAEHVARARAHAVAASQGSFLAGPGHALRMRAELERATVLDPASVEARTELARFYLAAPRLLGGGRARAAEQIAALERLAPARAAVLEGWRQHHAGAPRAAERELRRAVALAPDSAAAWFALAHVLRDAERNDGAVAALQRGLALRPDFMPGHWALGLIGATTGTHLAEAERALLVYLRTKPAKSEPPLATAHYRLGMVYEKQGRVDLARREYEAALKERPSAEYREALERVR